MFKSLYYTIEIHSLHLVLRTKFNYVYVEYNSTLPIRLMVGGCQHGVKYRFCTNPIINIFVKHFVEKLISDIYVLTKYLSLGFMSIIDKTHGIKNNPAAIEYKEWVA